MIKTSRNNTKNRSKQGKRKVKLQLRGKSRVRKKRAEQKKENPLMVNEFLFHNISYLSSFI